MSKQGKKIDEFSVKKRSFLCNTEGLIYIKNQRTPGTGPGANQNEPRQGVGGANQIFNS